MASVHSTKPAGSDFGFTDLPHILSHHAKTRPSHPALVEADGASVSYAELEQRVDHATAILRREGLRRGQRVAILGANSVAWVVGYLAALRSGGIAVPLNPYSTVTELTYLVGLVTPSIVLADAPFVSSVSETADCRVLPLELAAVPAPGAGVAPESADPDEITDAEDVAVLIATSGTSGDPKAVMLSHRALVASCANSAAISPRGADTVALAMLPMFHIYGLNAVLGVALYLGATCVVVEGYPSELGPLIAARQITEVPITPSILYRLMQEDQLAHHLAGVEHVMSGGAPLPLALANRFADITGFRLHQGYGMTETSPVIASTRGISPAQRAEVDAKTQELAIGGHVGPVVGEVEVRIGDGDSPSRPGEIHVRGRNLFSGYWPDRLDVLDPQGWFATGDIGFLAGEQLYLVDRATDLIIVSGFNVYPTEVERVLTAIPGVLDAAVLGQPDESTGERVVAFVTVGRNKPSLTLVKAECAERLARYKRPVEIYFVPKLPKTGAGKVAKPRLRALLDTIEAH